MPPQVVQSQHLQKAASEAGTAIRQTIFDMRQNLKRVFLPIPWVQQKPWPSLGVVALTGFAVTYKSDEVLGQLQAGSRKSAAFVRSHLHDVKMSSGRVAKGALRTAIKQTLPGGSLLNWIWQEFKVQSPKESFLSVNE